MKVMHKQVEEEFCVNEKARMITTKWLEYMIYSIYVLNESKK